MRYDLRHLTTFIAVAEELNFHRAAERLNMAQPAVSRIIQELEDRIGVRLLERTTRRVFLTETGRYLLEEAQEIVGRVENAETTARLLAAGTKAILRIGYTTISGHSLVPEIVREYRASNPDVRLELHYLSAPVQRDRVLQDKIDFAFIEGAFENAEIDTCCVARHQLFALLPAGHPLAAKRVLTVADLADEPLVLGTNAEWPTFRRILGDVFQRAGLKLSVGQEASCLTGILGLVTAGLGATVFCGVPRFCGADAIVSRLVVTDPPSCAESHLAWRRSRLNPAMGRFIEVSQKVAASYMSFAPDIPVPDESSKIPPEQAEPVSA